MYQPGGHRGGEGQPQFLDASAPPAYVEEPHYQEAVERGIQLALQKQQQEAEPVVPKTPRCPSCGFEIDLQQLFAPIPSPVMENLHGKIQDHAKQAEHHNNMERWHKRQDMQYTWNGEKHSRAQCPRCKSLLFQGKSGKGGIKQLWMDKTKYKQSLSLGGAILTGAGIGNYLQALRFEDQTISESYIGHTCFVLGMFFLAMILFRGTSWRNDLDAHKLPKLMGVISFGLSGLLTVCGLASINTDQVEGSTKMLNDIEWTKIVESPTTAGLLGAAVAFFVISMFALLYIYTKPRNGKHLKHYLYSAIPNTLGTLAVIGSVGMGADTIIRICNVADNIEVDEFAGNMEDVNMVTTTFTGLACMLGASILWLCWIFFKTLVFNKDNQEDIGYSRLYALAATVGAVSGAVTIVAGLAKYQGDQINEVLGEVEGYEALGESYSWCWVVGLIMIIASIFVGMKAKGVFKNIKC